MRFLCIYSPGKEEEDRPPSQEEMDRMSKLLDDMAKAGVLLGTGGCMSSKHGVRVRNDHGKFTVTDGPFPETKELIAGYCLMQVKSKAEALEWNKRFLTVMGEGQTEIRQLFEGPA
jgi:hypothetical protein